MPWFPDFVSAAEMARAQALAAGRADPVGRYLAALSEGDARVLESVWPGEVVVFDPRAGEIRGHRELRRFVDANRSWLAGRRARTEVVAATRSGGRAVVELLARLDGGGQDVVWPVAVVAESTADTSVVFRTYCSQWPVDGRRHVRPAFLPPGGAGPGDVVERYRAALQAGDAEAAVGTFAADGYYREPIGPEFTHRGTAALRSFFTARLGSGGIGLQHCAVTDDGLRCALEYNCLSWGGRELPPQAGLGVFERAPDGLLAAARFYDDVQPPAGLV
ncbi:nuclear transport factor 2 family protein [Actinomadura sp. GTD37]|uniref:nuclear transport factor 2 family protein n=1 Tax=Actinomadura sp. GTD37 TaxID=1778030 RepID=UPI0035C18392